MRSLVRSVLEIACVSLAALPAFSVPPAEVANLGWCAGTKNCLAWSSLPAPRYRIYRGTASTLPLLLTTGVDSCLVRIVSTATSGPGALAQTPASGTMHWFLVTATNCDGEGTAGSATAALRTVNASGDCTTATCSDGIQNGSEAGVDCGGPCAGCSTGTACCAGTACASGSCVSGLCATKPNGSSCTAGSQCQSTFCVDGYCCNSACTATCQTCGQTPGSCVNMFLSEPPSHGACPNCGLCNGAGSCCTAVQCSFPNGICVQ